MRAAGKTYRSYRRPHDLFWSLLSRTPRYREWTALHPLSLEIPKAQVVGVMGVNGAGKSTLLKLIAGTAVPSCGEIQVDGHVAALLELGAGFHGEMTGRENVYLGGSVMGLSRRTIDERFSSIVEFSELGERIDQPVKTYSSGMYQRLAFAVATAVVPDVLIIDETLSVGDGAFARKSFDRIIGYKKAGATILFCSHSWHQVEAICDRVLWLHEGKLMLDGEPKRVISAYMDFLKSLDRPSDTEAAPVSAGAVGAAHLLKVEVGADGVWGRELDLWSEKSELAVRVEFESDPKLPAPAVGLTIVGADGWAVTSALSISDGVRANRRPDGSGMIEVRFPAFALLKGTYWVSIFLLGDEGIHVYDRAERFAELRVTQAGMELGVVSLPREWRSPEQEPPVPGIEDATHPRL